MISLVQHGAARGGFGDLLIERLLVGAQGGDIGFKRGQRLCCQCGLVGDRLQFDPVGLLLLLQFAGNGGGIKFGRIGGLRRAGKGQTE
ncbi:hypothetical protein [Hoeflea ulvae]|uniref:Uncharacterized protein n=1 Tax=Hoeflea ulvae TaxID=2983764 RepID=A0ABT3Y9R0_9HYPH|nr:hypothetical protein [Hoeflea ulvae]MCY0092615.1 hypothetical protein [Hoeflea ulvae]